MIVVDTSVLSLAFRRKDREGADSSEVRELRRMIEEDDLIGVPGIVLQELLSGIRSIEHFAKLKDSLSGFSVLLASEDDHVFAADIANRCRWAGVSASTIDCLIAAIATGRGRSLFTLDSDFERIAPICGLTLHTA